MNAGLPGLRAADHVGMTVPDLDAAVTFYTEVFGGRELYRRGPISTFERPGTEDGRDWAHAHLNVAGAIWTIAMLWIAPNLMLELFQYDGPPDRGTRVPRNCDLGAHHIAFEVSNLEDAKAYLAARGCILMAGPIVVNSGPGEGLRVNYVLDPWGNQLELIEYPPGMSRP